MREWKIQAVFKQSGEALALEWDPLVCSRLQTLLGPMSGEAYWMLVDAGLTEVRISSIVKAHPQSRIFDDIGLAPFDGDALAAFRACLRLPLLRAAVVRFGERAKLWFLLSAAEQKEASPPQSSEIVPARYLHNADFLNELAADFLAQKKPPLRDLVQERLKLLIDILGDEIPGSARGLMVDEFYVGLTREYTRLMCEELLGGLADDSPAALPPEPEQPPAKVEKKISDFVPLDPIEIRIGRDLLSLVDPKAAGNGQLVLRIPKVRQHVGLALGLVVPGIRFRDDLVLKPDVYQILVRGRKVASGRVCVKKYLAIGPVEKLETLEGEFDADPTFLQVAKWIDPKLKVESDKLGCMCFDPVSVICTHLTETLWRQASQVLTFEGASYQLELHKNYEPRLQAALEKRGVDEVRIWQLLQELLRERVSIRDLTTILQTLLVHPEASLNESLENVRRALAPQITQSLTEGALHLEVVLLLDHQEQRLRTMEASTLEEVAQEIVDALKQLTDGGWGVVFLVAPDLRLTLRDLLQPSLPLATFLATDQLLPEVVLLPFTTDTIPEVVRSGSNQASTGWASPLQFVTRWLNNFRQAILPDKQEEDAPKTPRVRTPHEEKKAVPQPGSEPI